MLHLLRFGAHQRQMRERRESCGLALVQLGLRERVVATADQGLQQGVPRVMRLQPDFARVARASGATGDLDQLPGLAAQLLIRDGYGFGAEGDW